MLDVPMVDNIGDMLQLAIMAYNRPPKALAADFRVSVDAIYAACNNVRSIPTKARKKVARMGFLGIATVAMEATGMPRLWGYRQVDRHILSLLLTMNAHDEALGAELKELPQKLINKNHRAQLSEAEYENLNTVIGPALVERLNLTWNLLIELETKYEVNLMDFIDGKKKPSVLEHRRQQLKTF